MKVLHQDANHGEIKLMPENLDDIWHLFNIIQKNDLIRAMTYRSDEQGSDKIRSKKSSKKRMLLGIRVEEVKFHEFSDRLRIHGVIEEGPQDKGSYHTFNVTAEDMDKITIVKDEWKPFEIQRIQEAVDQTKQGLVFFVSLDDDNATLAILRQSGVQMIAEVESHRSGKQYSSPNVEKEYFNEIYSIIKNFKKNETPLVLLGPGFTRDHFHEFGKTTDPEIFSKTIIHATGNPGMNGIHEALKTGVIEHIARENRVIMETKLVEEFFNEIKKNGKVCYGLEEIKQALKNGAVEHLLIIDRLVRSEEGETLLCLAQDQQSHFTIINTMHDAGKKLEGIGGIGALLRYKFEI